MKSISEAEHRHGPNVASKSEKAVTYIQILVYYSNMVQTDVSLFCNQIRGGAVRFVPDVSGLPYSPFPGR